MDRFHNTWAGLGASKYHDFCSMVLGQACALQDTIVLIPLYFDGPEPRKVLWIVSMVRGRVRAPRASWIFSMVHERDFMH